MKCSWNDCWLNYDCILLCEMWDQQRCWSDRWQLLIQVIVDCCWILHMFCCDFISVITVGHFDGTTFTLKVDNYAGAKGHLNCECSRLQINSCLIGSHLNSVVFISTQVKAIISTAVILKGVISFSVACTQQSEQRPTGVDCWCFRTDTFIFIFCLSFQVGIEASVVKRLPMRLHQ